jgi:hypothetical protein
MITGGGKVSLKSGLRDVKPVVGLINNDNMH